MGIVIALFLLLASLTGAEAPLCAEGPLPAPLRALCAEAPVPAWGTGGPVRWETPQRVAGAGMVAGTVR